MTFDVCNPLIEIKGAGTGSIKAPNTQLTISVPGMTSKDIPVICRKFTGVGAPPALSYAVVAISNNQFTIAQDAAVDQEYLYIVAKVK